MQTFIYHLVIYFFQQMVYAENVLSDRYVFSKMFEDFNDLHGHREIYILLGSSRTDGIETLSCLDIFKSKRRRGYVQTIYISNHTSTLASKRNQLSGPALIVSLARPKLTALAANHVSFS